MTSLEEIKKAFPNMFRPLKWHHFDGPTEHGCGEWYAHATRGMYHLYDVRAKFPNDRPFYAKELSDQFDTLEQAQDAVQNRHEMDILMCLDPDFRSTLESLQREKEELRNLADRLKQEAQIHAMGSRCANATINEIYQIISGGKGEPGNWNGAEPVRRYAEAAEAEVKRLQAEIDRKSSMPSDHRYWEGRYRDEAADNEKLRGVVERAQSIVSTSIYPSWHDTARTALASTGGEHHAE